MNNQPAPASPQPVLQVPGCIGKGHGITDPHQNVLSKVIGEMDECGFLLTREADTEVSPGRGRNQWLLSDSLTNQAKRLAWVEIKQRLLLKQMSPKLLTRSKNGRLLHAWAKKSGVTVRIE